MKAAILSIFLIAQFVCCNSEKERAFTDFVQVEEIEKVIMRNNSGEFVLSKAQLAMFKKEISSMTYEPNISVKVGAIHMVLIINGKEFFITTATHGAFIEIDSRLVTKNKLKFKNAFFKTNGINFDNYKKGE